MPEGEGSDATRPPVEGAVSEGAATDLSCADPMLAESGESGAETGPGSARHRGAGAAADWVLVALITLLVAWTALLGVAFLPWHIGPVPLPISALLGVGAMILAPRACYRLTGTFVAATLPVAAWFVVSVWLVTMRNPMMLGQALSVVQGQWRVMLLLGLGSLAAAATLTLLWAERTRARYADPPADRPADDAGAGEPTVGSP